MAEMTMQDILAERLRRDQEERRLCDVVGADYETAMSAASLRSTTITRVAEEYGDGWWSRLEQETSEVRSRIKALWQKQIDDAFRSVIAQGAGPVSAVDLGWEYVHEKVPDSLQHTCQRWSPTSTGGLLLCGKAESGKTMALLALAWRIHRYANPIPSEREMAGPPGIIQTPVVWTQAAQLAHERTAWRFGEERPEFELLCERAKVLVIDDLFFADHRTDVVLEVVSTRMNRGLPTLTTCGFTEAEIRTRLGDSGFRRLVRCGKASGLVLEKD